MGNSLPLLGFSAKFLLFSEAEWNDAARPKSSICFLGMIQIIMDPGSASEASYPSAALSDL